MELLARGDLAGAVAQLDEAIELTPRQNRALLYYNRGTARHIQGNLEGAGADFDRSLAIDPGFAESHNNRGMTRQLRGALPEALDDFEKAIALDPRYTEAYSNRGIVRRAMGDLAGALADFEQAIALNGEYAEAHNNRGVTRQSMGDIQGAIADFDRAISLNPSYADAYSNRGTALHDLSARRHPPRETAFIDRSASPVVRDDLGGAIADFDRALALVPRDRAASILHNRGSARQAQGDLKGAIADFNEALTIDPQHIPTYANRGTAKKAIGDLEGAQMDLDLAVRFTPRRALAPVYHNRGGVRVLQSDFTGAVADYNSAIEIDPNLLVAYLSRGNARYHNRDTRALVDYWHALKSDPDFATAEIIQMLLNDLRHDVSAVLTNCDKHLRINPKDPVAYGRRGLTRLLMGDTDEQVWADLHELVRMQPGFKPALNRLVEEAMRRRIGSAGAPDGP
jgi:tetratricopeptide (TPR) repeat protein